MTTIYLVRHGETDENSKNIIQGRKNTHLNTKGVQKTKELRQTIISLGVDICYTSPLLRTLETAFGLVADKALIIKDDRLLERNMGIFDDKNINLTLLLQNNYLVLKYVVCPYLNRYFLEYDAYTLLLRHVILLIFFYH